MEMYEASILREYERFRKRTMAPLKKAVELAITKASKKNCWYDPWTRRGDRADYGVLYEPVDAFLKMAALEDILPMVEFLVEKANRQIEHSDDEGDCAGQARYWAHKLIKSAIKKNCDFLSLIDWAVSMVPKDLYFLTDAETMVLEQNKITPPEVWSDVAAHYKGKDRRIYLLALKKAGKGDERRKALRTSAKLKRDYVFLVEDALEHGSRADAISVCERGLADSSIDRNKSESLKSTLARLLVVDGKFDNELSMRQQMFERDLSVSSYGSLLEVAEFAGKREELRAAAIKKLEASGNWYDLVRIAVQEHRLLDAVEYYWRQHSKSTGCHGAREFDFDLADRLSRVCPQEAVKIFRRLVEESLANYSVDYECIRRALISLRPLLFALDKSAEWRDLLRTLRAQNTKKRNLIAILDELS